MKNRLFTWFETRIDTFPDTEIEFPRKNIFKFLWNCTKGCRKWFVFITIFSGAVGFLESYIYQMIGQFVDALQFIKQEGGLAQLTFLVSVFLVVAASYLIFEFLFDCIRSLTIESPFPTRLRYLFHNKMLGQSYRFYQNEFSGRISTKVLQTSLAVRDVLPSLLDVLMYVATFFITTFVAFGSFSLELLIPLFLWLFLFILLHRALILFLKSPKPPKMLRILAPYLDASPMLIPTSLQ